MQNVFKHNFIKTIHRIIIFLFVNLIQLGNNIENKLLLFKILKKFILLTNFVQFGCLYMLTIQQIPTINAQWFNLDVIKTYLNITSKYLVLFFPVFN